jgi:hypothetical protein
MIIKKRGFYRDAISTILEDQFLGSVSIYIPSYKMIFRRGQIEGLNKTIANNIS